LASNPSSFASGIILADIVDFNPLKAHSSSFEKVIGYFTSELKKSFYTNKAQKKLAIRLASMVDKPYKPFTFTDINGKKSSLSDQIGSPILIVFWASWCGPCVAEIPYLVKLFEKYRESGFKVVAISIDTNEEAWRNGVRKTDERFIHVLDQNNKIAELYNVGGIPDNVLIDAKGIIVGRDLAIDKLRTTIDQLY